MNLLIPVSEWLVALWTLVDCRKGFSRMSVCPTCFRQFDTTEEMTRVRQAANI